MTGRGGVAPIMQAPVMQAPVMWAPVMWAPVMWAMGPARRRSAPACDRDPLCTRLCTRPSSRLASRLRARLAAFARDSRGTVTIEFVLWLPVFCGLLMLFADTSLAYMNQSNFWNVSRETARIVARHGLDQAEAERFAETHARFGDYKPKAEVLIDGSTVTVTIIADAREITLFGILNFGQNQTIRASVTDVLEPI